jgi:hypothetical protein
MLSFVQERIQQLQSDLDVRTAEAAELRRELFALDAERDRLQVCIKNVVVVRLYLNYIFLHRMNLQNLQIQWFDRLVNFRNLQNGLNRNHGLCWSCGSR